MKKSRTSSKSKGNLAAEVARFEEKLEWGTGQEVDVEIEEPTDVEEPELGGEIELRHPQL